MLTENIWLAIIVAIPTLVGVLVPLVLRIFELREAAAKEIRDNARRDKVAADLKVNTEITAQAAQVSADQLNDIQSGQRNIHALVNSNLTVAKQSELSATKAKVALLREMIAMRGTEPTTETVSEIETSDARIAELTAELADRINVEQVQR